MCCLARALRTDGALTYGTHGSATERTQRGACRLSRSVPQRGIGHRITDGRTSSGKTGAPFSVETGVRCASGYGWNRSTYRLTSADIFIDLSEATPEQLHALTHNLDPEEVFSED